MSSLLLFVAAAAVGIDVGWQRLPEGGMQYIIQLEPQALESLRSGEAIESDIPPAAGEVRSYRIIVGKKSLPREKPPAAPSPPKPSEPKAAEHKEPLPAEPAVFVDPSQAETAAKPMAQATEKASPVEAGKPWFPLTFTLLGLFGSLGLNVYLGWIAWDARQRWHAVRGA